jgi:tripartite-type tricarboxylate transporter receptor subunit TctC
MQDLVAQQIDLVIDTPPVCIPQIRAGNIKAYAVMRATRLGAAPDIPTADEAGLPSLYATNWLALFAPKETSPSVVAALNAAVTDALADPTVRQKILDLGFDIPSRDEQSPEALAAFQKAEMVKWRPIIEGAGIKLE